MNGPDPTVAITLQNDAEINTTPGLAMGKAGKEITLIGGEHTVKGTQLFSIGDGKLNLQGGTFTGDTGAGALYIGSSSSAVVNISDGTTLEAGSNLTAGAVMILVTILALRLIFMQHMLLGD